MATIYKRPKTPYYWIKWKDGITGKYVYHSTQIRIDDPEGKSKAKMLKLKFTIKESERMKLRNNGNFDEWVMQFIESKYEDGSRTREQRLHDIRVLLEFFDTKSIYHPVQVNREHCYGFVDWRKKSVHTNTALRQLCFLSTLMKEALKRGYCHSNPASGLGIRKVSPKPKPEITEREFEIIENAIADREYRESGRYQFLRGSFEVAVNHGVRLSETRIHLYNDVDLEKNSISFHGKGDRYWTVPINPKLKLWVEKWRAKGLEWSYHEEYHQRDNSRTWRYLFRHVGLHHLCFHCFRVTFISLAERRGIAETVVMQLVNHSSTTVHRIYRRHSGQELAQVWDRL